MPSLLMRVLGARSTPPSMERFGELVHSRSGEPLRRIGDSGRIAGEPTRDRKFRGESERPQRFTPVGEPELRRSGPRSISCSTPDEPDETPAKDRSGVGGGVLLELVKLRGRRSSSVGISWLTSQYGRCRSSRAAISASMSRLERETSECPIERIAGSIGSCSSKDVNERSASCSSSLIGGGENGSAVRTSEVFQSVCTSE